MLNLHRRPINVSGPVMLQHSTFLYRETMQDINSSNSHNTKVSVTPYQPCCLFLYIHLLPSSMVTNLSREKPALTKAFTNVEAKLCLAESTGTSKLKDGRRTKPSSQVLYTSSGVLGSRISNWKTKKSVNNQWLRRWNSDKTSMLEYYL